MAIKRIQSALRFDRVEVPQAESRSTHYHSWRYGGGRLVQLTPDTAALVCGMRPEKMGGPDYVDGCRVVFIDDLADDAKFKSTPFDNNDVIGDPASGEAVIHMKHALWTWFVPVGAKLEDGRDHPHAGTGFGIQKIQITPVNKDLKWEGDALYSKTSYKTRIYQLEYRDGELKTTSMEEYSPHELPVVPAAVVTQQMKAVAANDMERYDWRFESNGLGDGVADGDGVLMPAMATKPAAGENEFSSSAGLSRWIRENETWRPVDFNPIAVSAGCSEQFWHEPSVVRLHDGTCLFTARPRFGVYQNAIRVWRSDDTRAWRVVFDKLRARTESPVTINAALDGTPYVALNPYSEECERKGYTYGRLHMVIRPLTDDFSDWRDPLTVDEVTLEAGKGKWLFDHPLSATIRLRDGAWRHCLVHRSLYGGDFDELGTFPHNYGVTVDVVKSDGNTQCVPWRFR